MGRMNKYIIFIKSVSIITFLALICIACQNIYIFPKHTAEISYGSPEPTASIQFTKEYSNDVQRITSCRWLPEKLFSEKISSIFWSKNSEYLFFLSDDKDNWYSLNINDAVIIPLTKSQVEENLLNNNQKTEDIAFIFGVKNYTDLFLAPEQKSIIFTKKDAGDTAVYLKHKDSGDAILMGKIVGRVDKSFWINNGKELLLSMDWQAPQGISNAYVYRIDLVKEEIRIEISNEPNYQEVTLLGVTPDGIWAMYVKYSGQDRSIILHNLTSSVEIKTSVKFPPKDYQWLTNDEFIAAGYLEKDSSTIYLYTYNLTDNEYKVLLKDIPIRQGIMEAILISPDHKYIAFIREYDQGLYLLECN